MSTCLIIFAKSPIPGKVKTRLIPHISPTKAAELYKSFIVDILSNALKLNCDMITIAYAPFSAEKTFHRLCGQSIYYLPQKGHNLGERMKNAFKHSFDKGIERTVIIGTDSPTLPRPYIQKAFDVLEEVPIVIGPTFDGGYYLVGLSEQNYKIFDDIEWSTAGVFGQTLVRVKALNRKLHILPPWYDVDTPDSLEFLRSHIEAMKLSGDKAVPEKTMHLLTT